MTADLRSIWRAKSDDDLIEAASTYWEFTEEAQDAIREEFGRRSLAGLPDALADRKSDVFAPSPAKRIRVIDVTRSAGSLRWIRSASAMLYFAGFILVLTLPLTIASLLDNRMGGPRFQEALYQNLVVAGLAGLFVLLGYGMARCRIWAAVLSLVIGFPPTVLVVAMLVFRPQPGAWTLLAPVALVVLSLVLPAVHLIRYRRLLSAEGRSIPRRLPLQARSLQDWHNWRGAAPFLVALVALPYLIVYLALIGVVRTNPVIAMMAMCPIPFYFARRKMTFTAARLRRHMTDRPILYLRSFEDDHLSTAKTVLNWLRSVEEDVALAFAQQGPVMAIGRPGERMRPIGAAREYVSDADWQERVSALIRQAQCIALMAGTTPGLAWEVGRVMELGALEKLVIVIPPGSSRKRAERWISTVSRCRAFDGVEAETLTEQAIMVGLGMDGEMVVIASSRKRSADYFEAASAMIHVRTARSGQTA